MELPIGINAVNNAGGASFVITDIQRLRRFLCLGCEGGTYYAKEKDLGLDNAQAVKRLLETGSGVEVVRELVEFSVEGRTAKQDPIIFVLAMCARMGDAPTQHAAYEAIEKVLRIPTHLFKFIDQCEKLSTGTGWGRAHRRAIQAWYNNKEAPKLTYLLTKYQQREGWSHKDLFRLCHAIPRTPAHNLLFKFETKGWDAVKEIVSDDPDVQSVLALLAAIQQCKTCDEAALIDLIAKFKLAREHIPNTFLNSVVVWDCLLGEMPMTAMLRNLAKMTQVGLLDDGNGPTKLVCSRLRNHEALRRARVHPFSVLVAQATYKTGHGEKGSLTWKPVRQIVDALDDAFYEAFAFVEPTNKRFVLALDVSGSMTCGGVIGSQSISPREASAAMAMLTMRTEPSHVIVGFSHELVPVPIDKSMRLDKVIQTIGRISMGGTDCAQPMIWAMENNVLADVFIVYTDNETWFGSVHPTVALQNYRARSGINAKLIVVGMTATEFTIADPEDPGMLDMAGFDANAPIIISDFVTDKI